MHVCAPPALRLHRPRWCLQSPELGKGPHIGVISPYKSQVKLLTGKVASVLPAVAPHVEVNSIDGFQGREKAIVIFSAVRSVKRGKRKIGFVADERRINVGLTRGRVSLLLVGNRHQLIRDERWATLIRLTADTGCASPMQVSSRRRVR